MALSTHNVVASFLDARSSDAAVRDLEEAGIPRSSIVVNTTEDEALLAKAEMRDEVDKSVAGPGMSLATEHQTKGAAAGTVVGTGIGAVLGLVVGFIFFGSVQAVLISVVCFAIGGATFGFLSGGFTKPRPVEDRHDRAEAARTEVGVHSDDQTHVERAHEILERHNADRLERFDSEGNPVPELRDQSGYDAKPSRTGRRIERGESSS